MVPVKGKVFVYSPNIHASFVWKCLIWENMFYIWNKPIF